jgi:hypothetical protein
MQLPEHVPVHDADGGVAMQLPMQLASSCPEHATSKLSGVHDAMHDADASSVHISVPLPWKMAAPLHAEFTSALAVPANKTASAASATATSEDQRTMD